MKIVYLLPLSLSLTRQLATSFTLKKGQDRAVPAYYLRPLEKSWYRAQCFFTLKRSEEIVIDSIRQRSRQRARPISLSMIFNVGINCLSVWSLNLCLSMGSIPWLIQFSISKGSSSPHPTPPTPLGSFSRSYGHRSHSQQPEPQTFGKVEVQGAMFFFIESVKVDP